MMETDGNSKLDSAMTAMDTVLKLNHNFFCIERENNFSQEQTLLV